jgi:hypothetical protein
MRIVGPHALGSRVIADGELWRHVAAEGYPYVLADKAAPEVRIAEVPAALP